MHPVPDLGDILMYALNLDTDGRILSATYAQYAKEGAVLVDTLPAGDIYDNRYVDGAYVHDPLSKPETPDPGLSIETRVTECENNIAQIMTGLEALADG